VNSYAACLTPPGAAAIAVIAVCGPEAWTVVGELFHPFTLSHTTDRARSVSEGFSVPLLTLRAQRFCLGRFGEDATDEVVLCVKHVEPVPWLELHCHGGAEVVRMCLDALERRGVEICSWQRLLQLTEDGGLRTLALIALSEARTVRTAAILLDQINGALETVMRKTLTALEHDDRVDARRRLHEMSRYAAIGRHLTQPWRVVVAGAPNVGKSSLVNALAGYQRSVVATTPGTTRDMVSAEIAVDGWPVELVDTAGLRGDAEALEEQGIRLARDAVATADLCLWVLDGSKAPVWPEQSSPALRFVVNKVDLPSAWDFGQVVAVHVSARTGDGVTELLQALAGWLVPEAPADGAAIPFTPSVCDQVAAAQRALDAGQVEETRQVLEKALWAKQQAPPAFVFHSISLTTPSWRLMKHNETQ
jgi:tRNA modification GTPase